MELYLKERIEQQGVAVGAFLQDLCQPLVVQLLAAAEMDFFIIDTEHGVFDNESVADLIRMGRLAGVIPLVRVIAPAYEWLCPRLDAGARGLIVPRISDAQTVRQAVRCTKYPPVGIRGAVSLKGQTDYRLVDTPSFLAEQNRHHYVIPQIELQAALDHLDEILQVEGIDIVLVGPFDLSIALGSPGRIDDPREVDQIQRVIDRCIHHGKIPGIAVGTIAASKFWIERGMRLVVCGSDVGVLRGGFNQIAAELKGRR
jgi:2-dehydro-3-deoxyglucarate aldolase/4-hydroxy-2-oxoheptanedioate aldolase